MLQNWRCILTVRSKVSLETNIIQQMQKTRSPVSKTQISFVSVNEANLSLAVTICLIAYLLTCSFAVLTIYSSFTIHDEINTSWNQATVKEVELWFKPSSFLTSCLLKKKTTWKYYPNTDCADGALLLAFEHSTFVAIPASITSSLWI